MATLVTTERAVASPEASGVVRRWAVILAGGDGLRLRPLTRAISGDERPKQFCSLLGDETPLDQTRRRAALGIPPHRTLVEVTRTHERFYAPALADMRTRAVLVQPENRGTAPAILYALLRLAAAAPRDMVAFLPSDHYVSDDRAFMGHVEAAFEVGLHRPDLVTLLGIAPDRAEVAYGWIEPADPVTGPWTGHVHRVRRFWEKPAPAEAERCRAHGCLWNSFVMVGRISTWLALIKLALPDLYHAFAPVRSTLGTVGEAGALERLYCGLPTMDFSRQVLAPRPGNLAMLPVQGVHWNDLGDPARVLAIRSRLAPAHGLMAVSA